MNGRDARVLQDEIVGGVSSHGSLRALEGNGASAIGSLDHHEASDGFSRSNGRAPVYLRNVDAFPFFSRCGHGSLMTRLILAPGRTSRENVFDPSPSRE